MYVFAFIKFTTKGGALKAIAEMNRTRLRGKIISVREARYRHKNDTEYSKGLQEAGDAQNGVKIQTQPEDSTRFLRKNVKEVREQGKKKDPHGNGWTKKIEIPVAKVNLEWLQRSLIGGATKAMNLPSLMSMIRKNLPQVVHVRELGAYKALMTFDSVLSAEEAYTFKMNNMLQFFHNVWRWNEEERSKTRRVWLECFGVLLHTWSVETFKVIESQWGEVIGCDEATKSCLSFSVGRVQIDTCIMDAINE
ncbi:uncharacterized protein LOC110262532 [Arachis ipaensis]|uniref:uncharacterized protein LOC110262532 n=1 Tax=Arachis ipaensis TaxID=130454 RepID=UPI000A2B045A|nr:uncharacterized protein LOC110262532 [Arachis ipaensis]